MKNIRVLVVDDHFVVRRGLVSSLDIEPDICVVCEASNGEEALARYREHLPDVVLMDWSLPRQTGPEVTEALRAEFPAAKVLILSALEGGEHVHSAVRAGALGYVFKSASREEILAAVRCTAAEGRYFPNGVAEQLAQRQRLVGISPREREVLTRIAAGFSNKQIAESLGITEGTVKIHISHILAKLDAKDRAHATSIATQRGIIAFPG